MRFLPRTINHDRNHSVEESRHVKSRHVKSAEIIIEAGPVKAKFRNMGLPATIFVILALICLLVISLPTKPSTSSNLPASHKSLGSTKKKRSPYPAQQKTRAPKSSKKQAEAARHPIHPTPKPKLCVVKATYANSIHLTMSLRDMGSGTYRLSSRVKNQLTEPAIWFVGEVNKKSELLSNITASKTHNLIVSGEAIVEGHTDGSPMRYCINRGKARYCGNQGLGLLRATVAAVLLRPLLPRSWPLTLLSIQHTERGGAYRGVTIKLTATFETKPLTTEELAKVSQLFDGSNQWKLIKHTVDQG